MSETAREKARARQAKRRASLKNNPDSYKKYLEKDCNRKATWKRSLSSTELEEHKLKERIRQRNRRAKQAASTSETTGVPSNSTGATPYRTTQALGKAVKRAQQSLPASPSKRLCVVQSLAKKVGLTVEGSPSSSNFRGLSQETKDLVNAFYNSDDISWQAPGRKDRIIIRDTNEQGIKTKRTEQVRYMLMSLKEAYNKFVENNSTVKIGLSKFCELRPQCVKLFDHIPHQVCICPYHENIRLLLVALKSFTTLSVDFHTFVDQVTCDSSKNECMSSKCAACRDKINQFSPSNLEAAVKYYQWQSNDKIEKVEIIGTIGDVFLELKRLLKDFLLHTYVKRKQSKYMKNLISNVDEKKVLLQVDFSENASIASQNEVQSAHWSHGSATLFTAHAWVSESVTESMVYISDDRNHTKYSVYVFIQRIINRLKQKYPTIEQLDVFTDGASSQFKQRFLFSNLHAWEQEHELKIKWHFFATSHGKGVVDGLGGTVKRAVWRHIRSGHANVSNAEEYAAVAQERNPNIYIEFVSKSSIEDLSSFLDVKWEGVRAVPQTHKLHCFYPISSSQLMVAQTSDSAQFNVVSILKSKTPSGSTPCNSDSESESEQLEEAQSTEGSVEEIEVGHWVVVRYDKSMYPGEVTSIDNDSQYEVNVMHPFGNCWKWPRAEDKIYYTYDSIVKVINPPKAAGNRGQFNFDEQI